MPQLLTVILNWRTPAMTLQSAEAALREMAGIRGAITIVDNDSGDGSFETMQAEVAARGWDRGPVPVRVLQSGRNGGFGAGNNFGIKAGLPGGARPDYVYILNSDAFPDPGAIRALLDHLEQHPATGFAGSYIHGPDGAPHRTAFRFPSVASELEGAARFGPISRALRRHIVARPIPEETTRVDWLAGASLMMRQDVLDRIGGFDEVFFLYFEETDLCLRAARAGWPTDYVRQSEVTHIGSVSTGMKTWSRIPRFWLDSRRHYFTKNHGYAYAALATLAHVAGGVLWRARLLVQRKDRGDPPHFLRDLIVHSVAGAGRAKAAPAVDSTDNTSPAA
ncbi:glycosyltransferase family 2 protein [Gemmobacter fulvus]|uniref:Glycosyltransferase family 2 protein n=2 Tax=Gemmobacter fulvus TaxID=2840474 RepID=A0A975S3A5_9RHOB|nr:glycosyltransferase family 2 protein [Gemmobacter fulvus]MBT9245748.1 glycosyltransferase family 2 protein [Gemmobacter fulvus]QWK92015.1 glycosyltransferase family 2 protein [Gemmobacter fulvus]